MSDLKGFHRFITLDALNSETYTILTHSLIISSLTV